MSFLSSLLNALPGAVAQGLIWGIMAIGVYITYRILDVADLTVDGSLATGGAVLVEGNTWHDNYWGCCTCSRCAGRRGRNNLGRLLMKLRAEYMTVWQREPVEK